MTVKNERRAKFYLTELKKNQIVDRELQWYPPNMLKNVLYDIKHYFSHINFEKMILGIKYHFIDKYLELSCLISPLSLV